MAGVEWVGMGRLISQFLGHVLPGVVRPLHALWNQMVGFLFLVLALAPMPQAIHYMRHFQEDPEIFRIVLSFIFFAVIGSFGVASFLRARKISRS